MSERKTIWVARSVMADALLWAACRKLARTRGIVWQEWLRRAMQTAMEAK